MPFPFTISLNPMELTFQTKLSDPKFQLSPAKKLLTLIITKLATTKSFNL